MKKRLSTRTISRQRGFTLVEVLVVVAIVGVLAAVAVPMVTMFIGEGETEAELTELHNVETAVHALLVQSADHVLDTVTGILGPTDDMSAVGALMTSGVAGSFRPVSYYMVGLNTDGTTRTGCQYTFQADGRLTAQNCSP